MNFFALIWSVAILLPLGFQPQSILYVGKSREAQPVYPWKGSGYKPTEAPSDSLWHAMCDSTRADSANAGH